MPSLRRRVIPIGSYIIATEPLPEELARELSPKGRAFFDTKNFLYYWHVSADRRMIFGGRASFLPTSVDRTAAILHRGLLEVHPQLAGYRIDYAWGGNVGFTFDRMPHVGRTRRRHVRDGLLRDRRRADDVARHAGRAVAGGGEAPALARLGFPLVPGAVRGPALVPAVRRRVVPAPGPARRPLATEGVRPMTPTFPDLPTEPPEFEIVGAEVRDGVLVRDIRLAAPAGSDAAGPIEAYLVEPEVVDARPSRPAILFAHWFDTNAPNGNRTEYVDEAAEWAAPPPGGRDPAPADVPVGRRPDRIRGRRRADRRPRSPGCGGASTSSLARPAVDALAAGRRRARLRRDARIAPRHRRPAAEGVRHRRRGARAGATGSCRSGRSRRTASTTSGRSARSTRSSTPAGCRRRTSCSSSAGTTSSSPR